MTIITLYRVQNSVRDGYTKCSGWYSGGYHMLKNNTERLMHPDCDKSLYPYVIKQSPHYKPDYIYGFAEKLHLFIWFLPHELRYLDKHGFHVYAIKVAEEDIIYGSRQLIFRKEGILSEEVLEIEDLLREYGINYRKQVLDMYQKD